MFRIVAAAAAFVAVLFSGSAEAQVPVPPYPLPGGPGVFENGPLSPQEVRDALAGFLNVPSDMLESVLNDETILHLDSDGDGELSFGELLSFVNSALVILEMGEYDPEKDLKEFIRKQLIEHIRELKDDLGPKKFWKFIFWNFDLLANLITSEEGGEALEETVEAIEEYLNQLVVDGHLPQILDYARGLCLANGGTPQQCDELIEIVRTTYCLNYPGAAGCPPVEPKPEETQLPQTPVDPAWFGEFSGFSGVN